MIYGNTTSYRGSPQENFASLSAYLCIDIAGQLLKPTGHAINPVPVTENQRIPDVDEVIEAQLFALYQALQHSLHRAEALQKEILPRLEEAAVQTRQGYETGRYSFYELQQLQSELLLTRRDLVEAAVDARRHQVEIERLTGTVMPSAVQQP